MDIQVTDSLVTGTAVGIGYIVQSLGLPQRFTMGVTFLAAILIEFLIRGSLVAWNTTLLVGILMGLVATGLYRGAPAVGARTFAKPTPPAPAPTLPRG